MVERRPAGLRHSIKKQMAAVFSLLMMGTILLCWFINNFFLGEYYISKKQNAMFATYQILNMAATNGTLSTDSFDIEFQKNCGKYNINYILLDAESKTLKTSTPDYSTYSQRLLNNLFGGKAEHQKLLETGEKYEIQIAEDDRTATEFLEMWGVLDNGNLFLFRSPLESIRESVKLANRFLGEVGIASAIISAVIVYLISRQITKPIEELTGISERMIHLDFDAKYTGKSRTEIAQLGQNINELSYTLEQTISELKSANNELRRDIERKNKIDEMRKEFLANVSHELKTPIALIQGYAEGLKEGVNDDPESREFYCEVIMDEAGKMNRMVKNLLALNQLEFGEDDVQFERFDITSLISGVLQSLDILIEQKEAQVIFRHKNPVYVWADEFKVEQVVRNYVNNALNHIDGEKVIEIKITQENDMAKITVFNTGTPIPEEDLPHIWEKFYKVDKARTREYGGNGIGLSIVKAIMDSFHQQCGVINHEDGVEFWFELEKGKQS